MPIDIRLLRDDKNASDSVRRWQMLRTTEQQQEGPNDGLNNIVDEVMGLDRHHVEAQKRLELYKKCCRKDRKRPDSEKLQSYQKEYDNLGVQLRRALWKIANAVDEPLLDEMSSQTLKTSHSRSKDEKRNKNRSFNSILSSPYSRLVEVGVLEAIGNLVGNESNLPGGILCWTGIGSDWARAISRHIDAVMKLSDAKEVQVLQLPEFLPMEGADLHDMLGCSAHCNICPSKDPVPSPSWLAYLKLNYSGQTLGDKMLPTLLSYSTISNTTTRMPSSDTPGYFSDPREDHRRNSFSKHKLPSTLSCMPCTVHYALILTSASWVDSRQAQQAWVQTLRDFYHSLITPGGTQERSLGFETMTRQRLVSPVEMLPGEASRIVVEGYIPPLANQNSCQKVRMDQQCSNNSLEYGSNWVILGYMSNFLDYPARACRIKNNQRQFCHVLHGTICSIPETILWQALNSTEGSEGVQIAEALAQYFPDRYIDANGEVHLPKIKSMGRTKQGRLKIDTIQPTSASISNQKTVTSNKQATVEQHQPSLGRTSNGIPQQLGRLLSTPALQKPLTNEQIQQEAMTSPFDFLPFYR